jgi:hypothetical protein
MGKLKGTLTGAAGGAAAGSAFGPWGTGIGGAVGGLLGYFGSPDDEESPAQNAVADARGRLEEMQRAQRAQRQQDLTRALGYFGPVNARLKQMYGVNFPSPTSIAPGMETARSGIGHFVSPGQRTGGILPPPPPPPTAAGAAAMFNGALPPGQSYGLGGSAGRPPTPPPQRQSLGKGYYR